MNAEEILKFAQDAGMLNITDVESMLAMQKRKEYLSRHTKKIWQGNDTYWYTYLPDGKNGRKLKKKKNKKDLEDVIIDFYEDLEINPTLEDIFNEWNNRRLELKKIKKSTYDRNLGLFQQHYSIFGKQKPKHLKPKDFIDFLEKQVSEENLTHKAFSNLKSLTRGVLKRAAIENLIDFTAEDVFNRLDLTEAVFQKRIKEDSEEVFNAYEMSLILNYLRSNPDPINLGICLMFVTGIRVGELVALKNEDFDEFSLHIRRTETRHKDENGKFVYEVKDSPKSAAGVRMIPVPKDYLWLIKKIRHLNAFREYIFLNKMGQRITTNSVRSRLRMICEKLDIPPRSPHKIRKTYGTILLDNNLDQKLIASVMGHADITCTEKYYHLNRRLDKEKLDILSSIPEFQAN